MARVFNRGSLVALRSDKEERGLNGNLLCYRLGLFWEMFGQGGSNCTFVSKEISWLPIGAGLGGINYFEICIVWFK